MMCLLRLCFLSRGLMLQKAGSSVIFGCGPRNSGCNCQKHREATKLGSVAHNGSGLT